MNVMIHTKIRVNMTGIVQVRKMLGEIPIVRRIKNPHIAIRTKITANGREKRKRKTPVAAIVIIIVVAIADCRWFIDLFYRS